MTSFWNNLHQVESQIQKIRKPHGLRAIKLKGLNRIAKIVNFNNVVKFFELLSTKKTIAVTKIIYIYQTYQ